MAFHISDELKPEDVYKSFSEYGFAHIAGILPIDTAKEIHAALLEKTPWNLVFNQDNKHFDMSEEQLRTLQKQDLARLQQAIFSQAEKGFQYSYHNYPIHDAIKAGRNEGHVLHRLHDWLNDEEFLTFARAATGFDDISFVDAQATRYGRGHFLCTHDDTHEGKNRRAAYVFNFTPGWQPDWGGYLQLLDEHGNVRIGLPPEFNALNILKIPQPHNVSFVTPFAGGIRLSVSGWFRYGGPE